MKGGIKKYKEETPGKEKGTKRKGMKEDRGK